MRSPLFFIILLCVSAVMAQTGLRGGTDGMRQNSAQTLDQANWLFGVGIEAGSGYGILPSKGYITDGETESINSYRPVVVSSYLNFAVGLTSFWDLGASMPFYYDHLKTNDGDHHEAMSDSWAGATGDLQVNTKMRVPIDASYPLQMAVLGLISTPTGTKNKGFYPRQLAFVNKNGGETHPFTSGDIVTGGGVVITLDLESLGIPMRFNGYGSYEHPWFGELDDVISWAFGLNQKSWEFATTFVELSGSHRKNVLKESKSPMCDRMLATAGMRFHLPGQWDLGLAADLSPIDNGSMPVAQSDKAGDSRYTVGNPNFGVSALLVYNRGRKAFDADKDGVPDSQDKCPTTQEVAQVDDRGCPLDKDRDGVADYTDKCPNTLEGIVVQANGCPLDSDQDGISDFQDLCPATPKGMPVDSRGCIKDGDKDGVPDPQDKCPNSPAGVPVDSLGCPQDSDQDAVPDHLDKCPGTPAGLAVDAKGCPADADKDGVADVHDKCPGTDLNISVDSIGCPRDMDRDGVPDHLDKCPATAVGLVVDAQGCPSDADGDGVRNEFDRCPNTPTGLMVDQHGCPADTDQDGVADFQDKCPGTPQGVSVDTTGCPADSDGDGVPDFQDKCPRTLKGVEINASGCPLKKEQDLTQLQRAINFKTGSAVLTPDSYATLDLVVALLKAIPTAKLEVQGHTDNTGSTEKNTQLSQERALAVAMYFVKQGIEKNRLRPKGYGPTMPIQSNATKAGRTANRRVELVPYD